MQQPAQGQARPAAGATATLPAWAPPWAFYNSSAAPCRSTASAACV